MSQPYGGTTTTVEAMMQGVPVVTLQTPPGADFHACNVGRSLLTSAGMADLVAASPDGYVDIASQLAADPVRLRGLRGSLRDALLQSPVGDVDTFHRHVDEMWSSMWRSYCAAP
jgi:protein O-GlcNAc transferase